MSKVQTVTGAKNRCFCGFGHKAVVELRLAENADDLVEKDHQGTVASRQKNTCFFY